MHKDERAGGGGQPQNDGRDDQGMSGTDGVGVDDQRQRIDYQLQAEHCRHGAIDRLYAALLVAAVNSS